MGHIISLKGPNIKTIFHMSKRRKRPVKQTCLCLGHLVSGIRAPGTLPWLRWSHEANRISMRTRRAVREEL